MWAKPHTRLNGSPGQASRAPDNIKGQLHYRDMDELDSGMQKVQQLDVLGKCYRERDRHEGIASPFVMILN